MNAMRILLQPIYLLFLLGLCSDPATLQAQTIDRSFKDSVLIAKTFPLLSLFQSNSNLQTVFKKNRIFRQESKAQHKRITQSLLKCESVACYAGSIKWTDPEINLTANELVKIFKHNKSFKETIDQLREQGVYTLYEHFNDTVLLRKAFIDAAKAINRIFDIYISGLAPRYSKIDSISFCKGDTTFKMRVKDLVQKSLKQHINSSFYEIPLYVALDVLAINKRDEATRYEPLNDGLNKDPFLKIKETDFSVYPYSVILIPGLGPEKPGMALDPNGAIRCMEGVMRFKKGLAPFIVVSGGNVHPFQTPFNEAVEMKKYIVEELGIPADVVFIEPHARHTTTNIRNTTRMIYRFGIPANRPVLIVTDSSQASYISGRMAKTAIRDLGYLPFEQLKQLNEKEVEFYPVKLSLHADPFDPLDQ
jgi:hypothetical protein